MSVIAMTREMGTRGREVAALVAERLASRLVYHELVNDPPDASGPSEVTRHLGNGGDTAARASGDSARKGQMTPVEVLELASRGNVILRGWGAVRVLAGIRHIPRIRICMPMEGRVAEMIRRLGISERAARHEIERSDNAHTSVIERFFGGGWRDAIHYDLVLNTARVPPEDCADQIVDLISRPAFQETDETRQALADRLTEARIARFLAGEPRTRDYARHVYVSVSGRAIRLYGTVRSESAAREIARAVAGREPCAQVSADLQNGAFGSK